MRPPVWLAARLKLAFPLPADGDGRKLEQVARRIDARTDTMATALEAISEQLRA